MISLIVQIIFWCVAIAIAIIAALYLYNVAKCLFYGCTSDDEPKWDYDE